MYTVDLRDLSAAQLEFAASLAARGMRDNPIEVAIFGDDPVRRQKALMYGFRAHIGSMARPPLGAWRGQHLVGILGAAPPGTCSASLSRQLRAARHMIGHGLLG